MLNVIMLKYIMVNVIMLSVIMVNVVAPILLTSYYLSQVGLHESQLNIR
jgi:hypothetical protein